MFGGYGGYRGQETWEYYNTDNTCCENLGVKLDLPAHHFTPGDEFYCNAVFCNNTGMALTGYPFIFLLDVYGEYYFGPSFTQDFDTYLDEFPVFPESETPITLIEPFIWPPDVGSGSGVYLYAAVTDPSVSFLYGDYAAWEISWGE